MQLLRAGSSTDNHDGRLRRDHTGCLSLLDSCLRLKSLPFFMLCMRPSCMVPALGQ